MASVLDLMVRDLHVPRFPEETEADLARRTAYTALRFWMQAFCIDDGYGGAYGVTQDAVERKALQWVDSLALMYPSVSDMLDPALIHTYCDALVTVGDLVQTPYGLLRCTKPHDMAITDTISTTLGLLDPTTSMDSSTIVSGAMLLHDTHGNAESVPLVEQYEHRRIPADLSDSTPSRLHAAWRTLCGWPTNNNGEPALFIYRSMPIHKMGWNVGSTTANARSNRTQ